MEVYYQLYFNDSEIQSKVAFDPEEPSLGRIPADFVAPPHSPVSIKRCISRVEGTPALAHADLFVDISCDAPLQEGYISILRNDGPGQSPNEPMAIVQIPIIQEPNVHPIPNIQIPSVQVESPSVPDGRYIIKNRAANYFWNPGNNPIQAVHFLSTTTADAKIRNLTLVSVFSPIIQVLKG